MQPDLPPPIRTFIGDAPLVADSIGESPCRVYSFRRGNDEFYLKGSHALYMPTTYSVHREAQVTAWAARYLNVPEITHLADTDTHEFMVTRRVPGHTLSQRMKTPQDALPVFQAALHALWAVPVQDCPFDSGVSVRLCELEYLIDLDLTAGFVDVDRWPELENPHLFLQHLQEIQPSEELVFSHGDLNDSNIFIDEHDNLHFIDLGRAGRADRWLDIAFAHRNLLEDISLETARELLRRLGLQDEPQKRDFFEKLDELF